MAKINYPFADGHYEEIEVTEEFKRKYEFLAVREKVRYWKIKKQKQRAGIPVKFDLSLEWMCEDGYGPAVFEDDAYEQYIENDSQTKAADMLLGLLTKKQRQVYELYNIFSPRLVERCPASRTKKTI